MHNLEIGTQFPDSENAWRNLEFTQIPRLRETYTFITADVDSDAEGL